MSDHSPGPAYSGPAHAAPVRKTRYRCVECGKGEVRRSELPAPRCGQTTEDRQEFPDGGWILTRMHTPHGEMAPVGEFMEHHPFEDLLSDPKAHLRQKEE